MATSGPKRTKKQVGRDRVDIARLYLVEHKTQDEIAVIYKVTQQQISYDLAQMAEEWRAQRLQAIDVHKDQELVRIGILEREYWDAWKRSQRDAVTKTTESVPGKPDDDEIPDGIDLEPDELAQVMASRDTEAIVKRVEKRVGQVGAKAFLEGFQWCSENRRKLMGLDAPTKVAPVTPDGTGQYTGAVNVEDMTDDQLRAHRVALAVALAGSQQSA